MSLENGDLANATLSASYLVDGFEISIHSQVLKIGFPTIHLVMPRIYVYVVLLTHHQRNVSMIIEGLFKWYHILGIVYTTDLYIILWYTLIVPQ